MKKMLLTVSALAFLSLALPYSSGAAVYEISAAGKNEAAAEGNCRANALRTYLNSIVTPADSRQHAMELRSKLFRNLRKFTEVEVIDTQKEAKRVRTRARVTVDEEAVRSALSEIAGLAVAPPPPSAGEENQGPAGSGEKQPEIQAADSGQTDVQNAGNGQAEILSAGNEQQNPEVPQPPKQPAMSDAEFIALVESAETAPQAVIDALAGGANPNAAAGGDSAAAGLPALMVYLGQESGPKYQDKKADVVRAFIKSGADVKWQGQDPERSVLKSAWYASMVQDGEGMEIFRAVLETKPDLNRTDGFFGRPFLHAWLGDAKHRTPEMLEYILSCGADPNLVQNDKKGTTLYRTPVLFDAVRGSVGEPLPPSFLQAMLRAGADPNSKNALGETVLCHAVKSGATEAVKLLLDAGADSNAAANNGETPLAVAVSAGNAEVAKMLVEKNADAGAAMPSGREKLSIREYAGKYGSEEIKALFGGATQ